MSFWNTSNGTFNFIDIFEPLTDIVGVTITYGLFAFLVGMIIWKYDETGYGVTGYLIFVGALGTAIMPAQVKFMFALLLSMGIGAIIYKLYRDRR